MSGIGICGRFLPVLGVPAGWAMLVSLECWNVPGTGTLIFTPLLGDNTFCDDCVM